MTMYRVQRGEKRLQQFLSTDFGGAYLEKDLEDWLEANPEVLTDGEPILVIGRQVTTETGGALDLLGLDAEGAVLVAELKRAPTPRDIVAQALEYAAWVDTLDGESLRQLAAEHLSRKGLISFDEAWQQSFGGVVESNAAQQSAILADYELNKHQRIVVVIEGANERIESVIRYLRARGVDISLIEYSYYKTDGGEEILDFERRVGQEGVASVPERRPRYTEEALVESWSEDAKEAYQVFREQLLKQDGIIIKPQKSAIGFYKQTRDGRAFVCTFNAAHEKANVWFRIDSLRDRGIDADVVVQEFRRAIPRDVQMNVGNVWCTLRFPDSLERTREISELVIQQITSKLQ